MPASQRAQDLTGSTAQLKKAGCQKIFREKINGTTADRPHLKKLMAALAHGDVVIIPAVDRLSRDTTDLLVIAREIQRPGAGIRFYGSRPNMRLSRAKRLFYRACRRCQPARLLSRQHGRPMR